jgi:hypothetical protein
MSASPFTPEQLQGFADYGITVPTNPTTAEANAAINILNQKIKEKGKSDIVTALNTKDTVTSKDILKLTPEAAKTLLAQAAKDAQYNGTFASQDITNFINQFQDAAKKQMAVVIQQASSGTTGNIDLADTVKNLVTTTYQSFFDPKNFAKDYVWGKINFADDKMLTGSNLATLAEVRQLVKDFNILGVSDAEIAINAKAIAKGDKTLADYTADLQRIAIQEHPQLADRLKSDPTLTVKKIAQPVISLLASTWEMDPSSIGLDDPIVAQYLRPGGADGKGATLNYADVKRLALTNPKYQYTTAANENARDAAVGLGRAMGAGF